MGGLAAGWKKNNNNINNNTTSSTTTTTTTTTTESKTTTTTKTTTESKTESTTQQSSQVLAQPVLINNKSIEIGIHGFWRDYKNTFAVIENSIQLNLDTVLTPYIPSLLYSQSGRVALAPVFGDDNDHNNSNNNNNNNRKDTARTTNIDPIKTVTSLFNILRSIVLTSINPNSDESANKQLIRDELRNNEFIKLLPAPLNVALLSDFTSTVSIIDRLSALSLLGIWADFDPSNRKSWYKYDKISAETIFRNNNRLSDVIYNELVVKLLHVLPMTTAYDCSAAAALSCFHVFALQSTGAFDVRWCRGTISDNIFRPWKEKMIERGNVKFLSNTRVTNIVSINSNNNTTTTTSSDNNNNNNYLYQVTTSSPTDSNTTITNTIDCHAVVLAVGITAAKRLAQSCSVLKDLPITQNWYKLKGVTCVAVRLYVDTTIRPIPTEFLNAIQDSPVIVCGPKIGNIPELLETGFCIYDLQRLQDDYSCNTNNSNYRVFEIDYFRANSFVHYTNEQIIQLTLQAITATFFQLSSPQQPVIFERSQIIDATVVRARDAVSHFTVNSVMDSGSIEGVRLIINSNSTDSIENNQQRPSIVGGLYAAGDWIDRTGHSAWSTEKAVVTGRQVAQAIFDDYTIRHTNNNNNNDRSSSNRIIVPIIPPPSDTPQLAFVRNVTKLVLQQQQQQSIIPALSIFGGGTTNQQQQQQQQLPKFPFFP